MELPKNMRSLSVAWFREEDWPRWCSIDPDFQPDFHYWLGRAEAALKLHQSAGHKVVKLVIDPDEFLEWSRAHGGKVDSDARAAFAAYKGMRKDTDH